MFNFFDGKIYLLMRHSLAFSFRVLISGLLCFYVLLTAVEAQFRFDSWTTDNGLPQISVNSIVQTRDGFLWFATFGGLVRYDGLRFKVFNTGNTEGLETSRFTSLFEDRNANLWITTEGQGISLYKDGKFRTFTTADGLPNNLISSVGEDSGGNFIVQVSDVFTRWDGEKFSAADEPQFGRILQWKENGDVWDERGGRIRTFENGRVSAEFTPESLVKRLFEDSAGRIWIALEKDILQMRADGKTTTFAEKDGFPPHTFNLVFEDRQKNVWFGTRGGGLVLFKDGKFTSYTTADGLIGDDILSIFQDREGTFWIGTTSGLSRMQPQVVAAFSKQDGLSADNIYPIYQDRSGKIWIGAWDGLTVYENGKFENVGARFSVKNDQIMSFLEDRDGNFWIGTWSGGVKIIKNGAVFADISRENFPGTTVRAVFQDAAGNVWLGTSKGLAKAASPEAAAAKSFTVFDEKNGFTDKSVLNIQQDRNGRLWFGTEAGLFVFADDKFTKFGANEGFADGIVRSIYEDADGVLWIGMYDSGVYRFKNGRFAHFTTNDGLYDNGAFQILEDADGNFWISSNIGIYRVKKSDLNDFADGKIERISTILYNKRDGMLNSECNGGGQPAGIKTSDGRLWFPTQKGAAVINPAEVSINLQPPPVVIESVIVDTKEVEKFAPLEILPGQVYTEIHYTGLSFIQPELVRFKYKLEGLDADWTEAGTRRTAYFSHLPPGKYNFRVLAANRDGVWNTDGAGFEIIVLPPFYQTWWFLTLTGFIIGVSIFLIYRRRIASLKRANTAKAAFARQLIESQEHERKRIASELHDSLGQYLLAIKNWALFGLNSLPQENTAREYLTEVSDTTSLALEEVREIAHNLRPYQLERLGLTNTLEYMLKNIKNSSAINFSVEIENIDGILSKESEIIFYRIVQETLNNVIKHSEAGNARIKIKADENKLKFVCRDDGKGFDVETAKNSPDSGLGLNGLAERVKILNGECEIDSEKEKGTNIFVKIPIN